MISHDAGKSALSRDPHRPGTHVTTGRAGARKIDE
jgi:hypothetical protein